MQHGKLSTQNWPKLDEDLLRLIQEVSDIINDEGFALSGGMGLNLLGVISRKSYDVDFYADIQDGKRRSDFDKAETKLQQLNRKGYFLAPAGQQDETFRSYVVTTPEGKAYEMDLGQAQKSRPFATVQGVQVFAKDDAIEGKMKALYDLSAEDYAPRGRR